MRTKDAIYRWRVVNENHILKGYILGRTLYEAKSRLKKCSHFQNLKVSANGAEDVDEMLVDLRERLRTKNTLIHSNYDECIPNRKQIYFGRMGAEEELDTYIKEINNIRGI